MKKVSIKEINEVLINEIDEGGGAGANEGTNCSQTLLTLSVGTGVGIAGIAGAKFLA